MAAKVHPTAVVDPAATLAEGVTVGPHAWIGSEVVVGEGCDIGAGAAVQGPTRLGRENRLSPGASLGSEPQDLKYRGERTELVVGDRNHFREFCTVNRGTLQGGGVTRIGDDNLFMAYTHVAHDCRVGSRCVLANGATLAGHAELHDDATLSAFVSVHPFCRVGRHGYVGGYTVLTQDALPFAKTAGAKAAYLGINRIGLERKGYERERVRRIEAALRLITRSGRPLGEVLEALRREAAGDPDIADLIDFAASARRGVVRLLPGRRSARGGGGSEEP